MSQTSLPPVLSIVGKSNSGKTTLLEKLIPRLRARGYRVGTVKHDVHGFDIDHPGKDSWRHREAGSSTVVLCSSERLFLTRELTGGAPSLREIVAAYMTEGIDLVLTEGYKRADAPKIEVQRQARSEGLICDVEADHLIAVASDRSWPGLAVPVFDLDDADGIAAFLIETFLA